MIVYDIVINILTVLDGLMFVSIPDYPTQVYQTIDYYFNFLVTGAGILANYIPFDYIMTLFFFVVTVDLCIAGYHFTMWLIRKLPVGSE